MKAVIQRVKEAKVLVDGNPVGHIGQGLLVLLGVHQADTEAEAQWLAGKVSQIRIFSDEEGKMNLAVLQLPQPACLVVSQFTLHAATARGNRPSFSTAARPEVAIPLYQSFCQHLASTGIAVSTGQFGADMQVYLQNDGPVTIVIDSLNRT